VTSQRAGAPAAAGADGRQDFDFLRGLWRIANRALEDPLAEKPTPWLAFEATSEVWPILGGLGNFSVYSAPEVGGRPGFHRFALRLFDCEARLWSIWSASTIAGAQLGPPIVGRFRNGNGRFEGDDVVRGRAIKVRLEWTNISPSSARCEQSVSFDNGESYETTSIMQWARIC
jgi:hypothetical protein